RERDSIHVVLLLFHRRKRKREKKRDNASGQRPQLARDAAESVSLDLGHDGGDERLECAALSCSVKRLGELHLLLERDAARIPLRGYARRFARQLYGAAPVAHGLGDVSLAVEKREPRVGLVVRRAPQGSDP